MLMILAHLCPACKHGNNCPGPNVQPSSGSGITCGDYDPKPEPRVKMSDEHILALPDREPCRDCAARKGTVPNGSHHSRADFEMCVRERQPFLCHAEGGGRICGGWLRAVKARAAVEDAITEVAQVDEPAVPGGLF
jgi:hypothetical protein